MKNIRLRSVLNTLFIVFVIIICLYPLVYVFFGATNESSYIFKPELIFNFGNSLISNFNEINENFNFGVIVFNSLFIALINSFFGIILMFLTAYAFGMYEFKGKKYLFLFFVITMFVSGNVIIINKFKLISDLNLKNTYLSLILPSLVNIHVLMLMIKNIEYINKETIEAARIDGSSEFQTMVRIGLPAVRGYIFIGFFSLFIQSWNSYLMPLLVINTQDLFTLPLLISSMSDPLRFKYGAVFLSLVFLAVPVIILLLSLSKYIFRKIN